MTEPLSKDKFLEALTKVAGAATQAQPGASSKVDTIFMAVAGEGTPLPAGQGELVFHQGEDYCVAMPGKSGDFLGELRQIDISKLRGEYAPGGEIVIIIKSDKSGRVTICPDRELRTYHAATDVSIKAGTRNFTEIVTGERLITYSGRPYLMVEANGEKKLVPEPVRAVTGLSEKTDWVIQDGKINNDTWLMDNQPAEEVCSIKKRGDDLIVNGYLVEGPIETIQIGQETLYLVNEGENWQLISRAVFEARGLIVPESRLPERIAVDNRSGLLAYGNSAKGLVPIIGPDPGVPLLQCFIDNGGHLAVVEKNTPKTNSSVAHGIYEMNRKAELPNGVMMPGEILRVNIHGRDHYYTYQRTDSGSGYLEKMGADPAFVLIDGSGMPDDEAVTEIIRYGRNDNGVWIADGQPEGETITITKQGRRLSVNGQPVKNKKNHELMIGEETMHLVLDGDRVLLFSDYYWQNFEAPKQKLIKWNVPPSASKEITTFLKTTFGPVDAKNVGSLIALGASEVGGTVGPLASLALSFVNTAALLRKEHNTGVELRQKLSEVMDQVYALDWKDTSSENIQVRDAKITEFFKQFGLSEKEIKKGFNQKNHKKMIDYLGERAYYRQTALGKIFLNNSLAKLNRKEKRMAAIFGGVVPGIIMASSFAIGSLLPGSSVLKTVLTRTFIRYFGQRIVIGLGRKIIFGWEKNIEMNAEKEARAKEWMSVTFGVMSSMTTVIATSGILGRFAPGAVEEFSNVKDQFGVWFASRIAASAEHIAKNQPLLVQPSVSPQPTTTSQPSATATATQTASPTLTPTTMPTEIPPTATEVPPTPVSPTETPVPASPTPEVTPTPIGGWQPGVLPTDSLLDQAEAAGLMKDTSGGGVQLNLGEKTFNLFRFDMDQDNDKIPEVWASEDVEGTWVPVIWELSNGDFGFDPDGDGVPQYTYKLEELPESILPSLQGGGGETPPVDGLPRDLDLDDNGSNDLLSRPDGHGREEFFIDRNNNGLIDDADEKVKIDWMTAADGFGQVPRVITFADGGFWRFNEDTGHYDGITKEGKLLWVDPQLGKSAAIQGGYVQQYKLLYSPDQIAQQATKFPNAVTPLAVPIIPAPTPEPEGPLTPPLAGAWPEKATGDQVWLDAQRGGVHGVVQFELHQDYPSLSPEQVTVAAHRLITDNKDAVEAFHQPVGDGTAVQAAMNDDSSLAPQIQIQVNVVQIEAFLVTYTDWLESNGIHLSRGERYEVARRAADQWTGWVDEDAKKTGLLSIAQAVEQEFANE